MKLQEKISDLLRSWEESVAYNKRLMAGKPPERYTLLNEATEVREICIKELKKALAKGLTAEAEAAPTPGIRCEGYRRRGGAFTLGPVKWEQCEEAAVVHITVAQIGEEGEPQTMPACLRCWDEACHTEGMKVYEAKPICKKVKR